MSARAGLAAVAPSLRSGRRSATELAAVLGRLDTDAVNQAEQHELILVRRLADDEVERVSAVLGLARLYQGHGFYLVVINPAGLDSHPTFAELARQAQLTQPVQVTARRVAWADIPDDPDQRVRCLDPLWLDMDAWVHDQPC